MTQTATETPAWQQQVADQVAEIGITDETSHLVVNLKDDGNAVLLDLADSEQAGIISAEDHATKVEGEVSVVPIDLIRPLIGGLTADLEEETPEDEPTTLANAETGADEDEPETLPGSELATGTVKGNDPEKGQLFDVAKIVIDETNPTVIKLSFAGGLELDRNNPDDVRVYNNLIAGKNVEITVGAFVASTKKTKRRDSEGNVDAVVETKSLVIDSLADTDEL